MKKKAKESLGKSIQKYYLEYFTGIKNILNGIFKRSKLMITKKLEFKKFDDLYSLLHNENLLIQAYGNIRTNKGSLTSGINNETIDAMSMQRIQNISQELKENKFTFKPSRRKYIPKLKILKPGEKQKMRPLGIPNFKDRLVQEAIRMILEAIYEPIFEQTDLNYGFRPSKGVHHNIAKLKKLGTGCTVAIEGDIKGAYDNVDHKIMKNILSKRINDQRFIKLLSQGFKAGILDQGHYEDTLLGVPQGGLASPILFNIYMQEYDEYIQTTLNEKLNQINIEQNRTYKPRNKEYDKIQTKLDRLRKKYKQLKRERKWIDIPDSEKIEIKNYQEQLQQLSKIRAQTPSILIGKKSLRLVYTRYADDWIILGNFTRKLAEQIKFEISNWLKENLKFELSAEKTLITNLKFGSAKFLGFSIRTYNKRRLSKNQYGEFTKTAGWDIVVDIDLRRQNDTLYLRGFTNKFHKPIAKKPWSVLSEEQIITKYNQIMRGLANYFLPVIDRRSNMQYLIYILYFSCLATFAKKFNTKITKITDTYGNPLRFTLIQKVQSKNLQGNEQEIENRKIIELFNYKNLIEKVAYIKYNWKTTKIIEIPETDVYKPMQTINWRSRRNLNTCCSICGTYKDVEMHHISAIRKGKVVGFTQVLKSLNRKQIPLCKTHHRDVHNGKYDGIKLEELYKIEYFLY